MSSRPGDRRSSSRPDPIPLGVPDLPCPNHPTRRVLVVLSSPSTLTLPCARWQGSGRGPSSTSHDETPSTVPVGQGGLRRRRPRLVSLWFRSCSPLNSQPERGEVTHQTRLTPGGPSRTGVRPDSSMSPLSRRRRGPAPPSRLSLVSTGPRRAGSLPLVPGFCTRVGAQEGHCHGRPDRPRVSITSDDTGRTGRATPWCRPDFSGPPTHIRPYRPCT